MSATCTCGRSVTGTYDDERYRYACGCGLTIWAYNDDDATEELAHPLNTRAEGDGPGAVEGDPDSSGDPGDE